MKKLGFVALVSCLGWVGCGGSSSTFPAGGCKIVFSGAVHGTDTERACANLGIGYDNQQDQWTFYQGNTGETFGAANYNWQTFTVTVAGMPKMGVFDDSNSVSASAELAQTSQGSTGWDAASGSLGDTGSISLTIEALDAGDGSGGFNAPHGSATLTLVDSSRLAANVMATLTF